MSRPNEGRSVAWAVLGALLIVGAVVWWGLAYRGRAAEPASASVRMTASLSDEKRGDDLYVLRNGLVDHKARRGSSEPRGNVVPGLPFPLRGPLVDGLKYLDEDCVRIIEPEVRGHFCFQRWINPHEDMETDIRLGWLSGVARSRNGATLTAMDASWRLANAAGVLAESDRTQGAETQFTWWTPTGSVDDLDGGCRKIEQGFTATPVEVRSTFNVCGESFGPGPQIVGPKVMSFRWQGHERSVVEFQAGVEWQFPPQVGYELRTLVDVRTD